MKNYTYGWLIKDRGFVEVCEADYTEHQIDMKEFIESMSTVIAKAHCGWSGVKYKVMKHDDGNVNEYMVLWVNGGGDRWIIINGNSKGCNFSVLGENLW